MGSGVFGRVRAFIQSGGSSGKFFGDLNTLKKHGACCIGDPLGPNVTHIIIDVPGPRRKDYVHPLSQDARPWTNKWELDTILYEYTTQCGAYYGSCIAVVQRHWIDECLDAGRELGSAENYGGWLVRGTLDPRLRSRAADVPAPRERDNGYGPRSRSASPPRRRSLSPHRDPGGRSGDRYADRDRGPRHARARSPSPGCYPPLPKRHSLGSENERAKQSLGPTGTPASTPVFHPTPSPAWAPEVSLSSPHLATPTQPAQGGSTGRQQTLRQRLNGRLFSGADVTETLTFETTFALPSPAAGEATADAKKSPPLASRIGPADATFTRQQSGDDTEPAAQPPETEMGMLSGTQFFADLASRGVIPSNSSPVSPISATNPTGEPVPVGSQAGAAAQKPGATEQTSRATGQAAPVVASGRENRSRPPAVNGATSGAPALPHLAQHGPAIVSVAAPNTNTAASGVSVGAQDRGSDLAPQTRAATAAGAQSAPQSRAEHNQSPNTPHIRALHVHAAAQRVSQDPPALQPNVSPQSARPGRGVATGQSATSTSTPPPARPAVQNRTNPATGQTAPVQRALAPEPSQAAAPETPLPPALRPAVRSAPRRPKTHTLAFQIVVKKEPGTKAPPPEITSAINSSPPQPLSTPASPSQPTSNTTSTMQPSPVQRAQSARPVPQPSQPQIQPTAASASQRPPPAVPSGGLALRAAPAPSATPALPAASAANPPPVPAPIAAPWAATSAASGQSRVTAPGPAPSQATIAAVATTSPAMSTAGGTAPQTAQTPAVSAAQPGAGSSFRAPPPPAVRHDAPSGVTVVAPSGTARPAAQEAPAPTLVLQPPVRKPAQTVPTESAPGPVPTGLAPAPGHSLFRWGKYPLTFYVLGDRMGTTTLLITHQGGGEVVSTLGEAMFVLLPVSRGQPLVEPEHVAIARREGIHPLARVLSQDWVWYSLQRGELLDMTSYFIPFASDDTGADAGTDASTDAGSTVGRVSVRMGTMRTGVGASKRRRPSDRPDSDAAGPSGPEAGKRRRAAREPRRDPDSESESDDLNLPFRSPSLTPLGDESEGDEPSSRRSGDPAGDDGGDEDDGGRERSLDEALALSLAITDANISPRDHSAVSHIVKALRNWSGKGDKMAVLASARRTGGRNLAVTYKRHREFINAQVSGAGVASPRRRRQHIA